MSDPTTEGGAGPIIIRRWAAYEFLRCHGTKVLAVAQGLLAAVAAVPGVVPPEHLPYWMGVLAGLTYLRGQFSPVQPQKHE